MAVSDEMWISADSHMSEPPDLWQRELPPQLRERAPQWPHIKIWEEAHYLRAGGWDPQERLKDLAIDGISAEVLYPTLGLQLWGIEDLELQEACIRVYNDWLIDFCSAAPDRFWGLGIIPLRNVEHAVKELERCRNAGMRGAAIWIATPPDLPYSSPHFEPFWQAAEHHQMPLALHINARGYAEKRPTVVGQLYSANNHKFSMMTSLGHLICSGVLERHPELKVIVAEIGIGWIPFWLQEIDYYTARVAQGSLRRRPSETFYRQVASSYMSDRVGSTLLPDLASEHGADFALWASDYPHPACVWPDSIEVIDAEFGHLDPAVRSKVVAGNAAKLFNNGQLPPPIQPAGSEARKEAESFLKANPDFGAAARPRTVWVGAS